MRKEPHRARVEQLELLVDELIKDSPQESTIRDRMAAVGLDYLIDPIARMNVVLSELGEFSRPKRRRGAERGEGS